MIRTFTNTYVPGLLQTPAYVELIHRAIGSDDPAEIVRHVDARMERQKVLTREEAPCHLHAVIDENAVLRISSREVQVTQVKHLLQMAQAPGITVQLLPIADGIYPGGGEVFTCLQFPDLADRDIVYLETTVDDRMLEEADELERYMGQIWSIVRGCTLVADATRTYLTRQIE